MKASFSKSKVYADYVRRCSTAKRVPLPESELAAMIDQMYKVLRGLMKYQNAAEPYIAAEIDDEFTLYMAVGGENLVVNIWDKEQAHYLLRGGGTHAKRNNQ